LAEALKLPPAVFFLPQLAARHESWKSWGPQRGRCAARTRSIFIDRTSWYTSGAQRRPRAGKIS